MTLTASVMSHNADNGTYSLYNDEACWFEISAAELILAHPELSTATLPCEIELTDAEEAEIFGIG